MTQTVIRHRSVSSGSCELPIVPAEHLDIMLQQILRAVARGHRRAPDLDEAVSVAVTSFARAGSLEHATRTAMPGMEAIGSRLAEHGVHRDHIDRAFRCARGAAHRYLTMALGDAAPGYSVIRLREHLNLYLSRLHAFTRRGWEKGNAARAASEDRQRRRDHEEYTPPTAGMFYPLGGDQAAAVVAVVAVLGSLPGEFRRLDGVVTGESEREAVVPADWSPATLAELLDVQVVVGPPAAAAQVMDSLDLARRGAVALRTGVAVHEARVVRCDELLEAIVFGGNSLMGDMLVKKHLGPLAKLKPKRRVALGELLQVYVGSSVPIAHIADKLGEPTQTIHGRWKALRKMFDSSIEDDASTRLEISIALRAALPVWRDEASRRR